ncbi:MAG: aminomethyl-transferring glycine dehydrogenase subunit GcvPA [Gammaproteobacteria bacterium]|nr:aminomethyl-transferring glycine dehydrogenase subunit GcvPA [Gammaproteobacteria bacterium]
MSFIPHTPDDTARMLGKIGIKTIEAIFDEIPKEIPKAKLDTIPDALNEMALLRHAKKIANELPVLSCFLGAGAYDHHIPAAIWDICTRGEFLTAYTPYQAEVSQGSLQILYEFQTMIAELFALDVANASLYDGATAVVEAILMAKRLDKKGNRDTVLVPKGLHPHYRQVLTSLLKHQQIKIEELPFDNDLGQTCIKTLQHQSFNHAFAMVISQCNFFGVIEAFDELNTWAKAQGLFSIAQVHPMALGILKAPGQWAGNGADIAVGEGQALGIPLASGGPYLGLMACKKEYVRQLPGRIVGRTIDTQGRTGFALTLQAREQHIRRAKATSNICTNQGLNVVAATIFMSMLGPTGLAKVGEACVNNTHTLIEELCHIAGVSRHFNGYYFHESVVDLPIAPDLFCDAMLKKGILAGLSLAPYFPEFKNSLLLCATEKQSMDDIKHYIQTAKDIFFEHSHHHNSCTLGV